MALSRCAATAREGECECENCCVRTTTGGEGGVLKPRMVARRPPSRRRRSTSRRACGGVHRQVQAVASEPALGVSGSPCMGCMPWHGMQHVYLPLFFSNRKYSLLLFLIRVLLRTSLPKTRAAY
jgi:hypothetical protein